MLLKLRICLLEYTIKKADILKAKRRYLYHINWQKISTENIQRTYRSVKTWQTSRKVSKKDWTDISQKRIPKRPMNILKDA